MGVKYPRQYLVDEIAAKQIAQQQAVPLAFPRTTLPQEVQHQRALSLLMNRLCGVRDDFRPKPDDLIYPHIYHDMVILFLCLDGKEMIVKEPADIFPSDTLITQLRMIIK